MFEAMSDYFRGHSRRARSVMLGAWVSIAFLVSAVIVPAHATELSYNYGSFAYSNIDGLDGWSGDGSFEVGGNVRLTAGASFFETNSLTLRTITFGAGYIARLSPAVDLIVDAGFLNSENQFLFFDAGNDEWGGFGGLSLRVAAGDRFEIEPAIGYTKLFDVPFNDDDFLYGLTARVFLGGRIQLEGSVAGSAETDDPVFSIGMRFGPKFRPSGAR